MTKSFDYYSNKIRFNIERLKIEISYLKHRSNSYVIKQKENGFITTLRSPESESSQQILADSSSQFDGFSMNENTETESTSEDAVRLNIQENTCVYTQQKEREFSDNLYNEEQLKLHVLKTRNSNTESPLKKRQSYTSSNYSYENVWSSGADKTYTPEPYRRISNNILPMIKKTGLKLLKIEPLPIKDPSEIEELEETCSGLKLENKSSLSNDSVKKHEHTQNNSPLTEPIELKVSEKTNEKYIFNPMSLTAARISIEKRVSSNMIKETGKIERIRMGSSTSSKGTIEKFEKHQDTKIEVYLNKAKPERAETIVTEDLMSSSAKNDRKNISAYSQTENQNPEQELTEIIEKPEDKSEKKIEIRESVKLKEINRGSRIVDNASVRKISVRSLNSDYVKNNASTNNILKGAMMKSRPNTRASMDRTFDSYGDLISDYANESFKENDV